MDKWIAVEEDGWTTYPEDNRLVWITDDNDEVMIGYMHTQPMDTQSWRHQWRDVTGNPVCVTYWMPINFPEPPAFSILVRIEASATVS